MSVLYVLPATRSESIIDIVSAETGIEKAILLPATSELTNHMIDKNANVALALRVPLLILSALSSLNLYLVWRQFYKSSSHLTRRK